MALNKASWAIELNCQCPKCEDHVNLINSSDFWECGVDCLERATNLEVSCPKCHHEFVVDCEY